MWAGIPCAALEAHGHPCPVSQGNGRSQGGQSHWREQKELERGSCSQEQLVPTHLLGVGQGRHGVLDPVDDKDDIGHGRDGAAVHTVLQEQREEKPSEGEEGGETSLGPSTSSPGAAEGQL